MCKVEFLMSVLKFNLCVEDIGYEIVFVGCLNVGKFSVINVLIN